MIFQSTQPSQAVTISVKYNEDYDVISIHTALAGCDQNISSDGIILAISIHTALAGCDDGPGKNSTCRRGFQSTQPSQAVTDDWLRYRWFGEISIHTALAGCDCNNTQHKQNSNKHYYIQCITFLLQILF